MQSAIRTDRYDASSSTWHGDIEAMGFQSAYRGFLEAQSFMRNSERVCDMGTGTGAMALAWCDVFGPPQALDIVDPSRPRKCTDLPNAPACAALADTTSREVSPGVSRKATSSTNP